MKVVEICDNYGLGSLQRVERPDPVAESGQVVLEMRAFSINYRDLLVVNVGIPKWCPGLSAGGVRL